MSLYVFAPAAAAGCPAAAVGELVAGAWPQLASSIANARNATVIVVVNLEAVIAYSFDIVIVDSLLVL